MDFGTIYGVSILGKPERIGRSLIIACRLQTAIIGLQGFPPKLAKGEIASLSGAGDDARYFQISVPVQPGANVLPASCRQN